MIGPILLLIPVLLIPVIIITVVCCTKDEFWSEEVERRRRKKRKKNLSDHPSTIVIHNDREENLNHENESKIILHFVFLVNGWGGMHKDLTFMNHLFDNHPIISNNNENNNIGEEIIIHQTMCNQGFLATSDGVAAGGQRVAKEILTFIQSKIGARNNREKLSKVTISTIGFSLGGLYSRYAISKIYKELSSDVMEEKDEKSTQDADKMEMKIPSNEENETINTVTVEFNLFASVASPHLGLKQNTFFSVFSFVENIFAFITSTSGREVFHYKNDLYYKLATCPSFIHPLSLFRTRILFANSYQTDFLVPTNTSAFLHPNNTIETHRVLWWFDSKHNADFCLSSSIDDNDDNNNRGNATSFVNSIQNCLGRKEEPLLKAIFQTDQTYSYCDIYATNKQKEEKELSKISSTQHTQRLEKMSKTLDSLGWTKYFFDMRSKIPLTIQLRKNKSASICCRDVDSIGPDNESKNITRNLNDLINHKLKTMSIKNTEHENEGGDHINNSESEIGGEGVVSRHGCYLSSKEIAQTLCVPYGDCKFSLLPLAHRMLCAATRDKFTCLMFRGGRPACLDICDEIVTQISLHDK